MGDMVSEMLKWQEKSTPNESKDKHTVNETQPNNIKLSNVDRAKNQQHISSAIKNDASSKGNRNSTFESRKTPANADKINNNNMENKTDPKNSHTKDRPQNRGTSNISKDKESFRKRTYPNNIEEFGDKFVNPYNFIRLGIKVSRDDTDKADFSDKLLTGSINCTLRTKTPIFIPNITNDNAFGKAEMINVKDEEQENKFDVNKEKNEKHKNYDFFSYNDLSGKNTENDPKEPIIPGSSIRGVIRSAFEALTDSCMMTSDLPLTIRESKAKSAGILVKDKTGWKLYKAEKYMIRTGKCEKYNEKQYKIIPDKNNNKNKCIVINEGMADEKIVSTGDKIKFSGGNQYKEHMPKIAINIGTGDSDGILLLGEPFGTRKHHDSIFAYERYNSNNEIIEIKGNVSEAVEKLKLVLDAYNDSAVNRKLGDEHNGYKHYSLNNIEEGMEYPVWYEKVGNTIYFAPACISRTALYNTITEILKRNDEFNSCSNASNLCSTCELFGMVGDNSALGSKIRFSDAKLTDESKNNNEYYEKEIITLDELSSPKLSAVEFYTKRPNEKTRYWNYDYCGNNNDCIKLLGRKYYWHSANYKKNYDNNISKTKRNVTIRPVKPEVNFKFDIYFERITKKELKKLIWVLTIGENNINGNRCHKIGGARPLGFGSVKIAINNVKYRNWSTEEDGTIIRKYEPIDFAELLEEDLFKGIAFEEFLKITNFNSMQGNSVKYPFGKELKLNGESTGDENDEGGHVWFKLNRIAGEGAKEMKKNIKFTLKGILEDTELPQLLRKNSKK